MKKTAFNIQSLALLAAMLSAGNVYAGALDLTTWTATGDVTLGSPTVLNSDPNYASPADTSSFKDQFGNSGSTGATLVSGVESFSAGTTLTINFDFATQDSYPVLNDFAYLYFGNSGQGDQILFDSSMLAHHLTDSGAQTRNYTFSSNYDGTIGFVVSNGTVASFTGAQLTISGVSFSTPASVPEPEEWAMLLLGLSMMAAAVRRKQSWL
ncbi:MAG: PEP-CTERM sorting domain-containing protein [Methylomonas sp.]|jgi:hypothetical protein